MPLWNAALSNTGYSLRSLILENSVDSSSELEHLPSKQSVGDSIPSRGVDFWMCGFLIPHNLRLIGTSQIRHKRNRILLNAFERFSKCGSRVKLGLCWQRSILNRWLSPYNAPHRAKFADLRNGNNRRRIKWKAFHTANGHLHTCVWWVSKGDNANHEPLCHQHHHHKYYQRNILILVKTTVFTVMIFIPLHQLSCASPMSPT